MCTLIRCTLLLVSVFSSVNCVNILKTEYQRVENGDAVFPKSFSECVDLVINPRYPKDVIQAIQIHCLDRFISIDHTHEWATNFTTDEQHYIKSIFRKVISDAAKVQLLHSRHRRDVGVFQMRVRHEVRESYVDWQNFVHNVRRLKYEAISPNGRSKYDIIADIHGTAIRSAHFGPNFLSWHRLYLVMFQAALGVPIPYWDSTIDFEMHDPTESILWSEKYFGNGYGFVKTGPYANFKTPLGPLFRNIGSDGCLFNHRGIEKIFRQYKLAQISEPTAAEGVAMETQHNDIHIWVDGQMNNIEVSPHDPVFYNHHSFVDHLWEIFRTLQVKRGIDPTCDVVSPENNGNITFQNYSDPAVGLTGYYNNDGYSNEIAALIKFSSRPQCPFCSNSPDLFCDKQRNVCLSRQRNPMEYRGIPEESMEAARECGIVDGGSKSHPFPLYERDGRVRMDSVTMHYGNQNNQNQNGNVNARSTSASSANGINNRQSNMNNAWYEGNQFGVHENQMSIGNFMFIPRGIETRHTIGQGTNYESQTYASFHGKFESPFLMPNMIGVPQYHPFQARMFQNNAEGNMNLGSSPNWYPNTIYGNPGYHFRRLSMFSGKY